MSSLRIQNLFSDVLARATHHSTDGIEDYLELRIVFLLKGVELLGELGVRSQHLTEANEGAHDLNVLYGSRASQHTRQHGYALLGERVREVAAASPRT